MKLSDEPAPLSSHSPAKLKICLIRTSSQRKTEFEFHETTVSDQQGAYEEFINWLESVAEPQRPAIWDGDVYNSIDEAWAPPNLDVYQSTEQLLEFFSYEKEMLTKEHEGWSYKKLVESNNTPMLTGVWRSLKT